MGWDIHIAVEAFNPHTNQWELQEWDKSISRNYSLFSVLAGVRNSRPDTLTSNGYPVTPISEPRGLPKDLSLETDMKVYLGDHSFSWVTLKELKEYNWGMPVNSAINAPFLKKASMPEDFEGDIVGWSLIVQNARISNGEINSINNTLARRLIIYLQHAFPDKTIIVYDDEVTQIETDIPFDTVLDIDQFFYGGGQQFTSGGSIRLIDIVVNGYTQESLKDRAFETIRDVYTFMSNISKTEDGSDVRLVFGFDN